MIRDPDRFFADRGFRLVVEERNLDFELPDNAPARGRGYWADLMSIKSDDVAARS